MANALPRHLTEFLSYDALTSILRGIASKHPEFVRLHSLTTTPEGRELWCMTIAPDPDRARPSVWVDANMHAVELSGTNVCVELIERLVRLHTGGDHGFAEPLAETLRDVRFFVCPRMAPDGAESVVQTGRYVRSNPRAQHADPNKAYWAFADMNGDGKILVMRQKDPAGDFVESKEFPGILLPRELDDEGPFYKLYPEGYIVNFDGSVPNPYYLSDNDTDLNRNFPYGWKPETDQAGAGRYPMSDPEARAVVEFTTNEPTIFAWMNYHCFGGVFIRPLGGAADTKMKAGDLALYKQLGAWAEQNTGYPTVSGFEEFTYDADVALCGDVSDYAYHQRGAVALTCELWDLFARIGMKRPKRFVDYYTEFGKAELLRLAAWDKEHNNSMLFVPWHKVQHPQLGELEVGGVDTRVGQWNPPASLLPELCKGHTDFCGRLAALAPKVGISLISAKQHAGFTRLQVRISNTGYLPTHVLDSAKDLPHAAAPSLFIDFEDSNLAPPRRDGDRSVPHLSGWGTGLGASDLLHGSSRGSQDRYDVEIDVPEVASGVRVRWSCPRIGEITRVFAAPYDL